MVCYLRPRTFSYITARSSTIARSLAMFSGTSPDESVVDGLGVSGV